MPIDVKSRNRPSGNSLAARGYVCGDSVRDQVLNSQVK
jgi:hypothetical protein